VRLGELAEHRLGKMLDKAKNTGVPRHYLRNPNVRWFDFDLSDLQEILVEEKDVHKYALRYGDVIICEGGEAGRAALWRDEAEGIIFQKACHRVRVGPKLDARFLIHRLMFDYFNGGLEDYYTGATIKHFTGQDLARYEIPLPPLTEQRRIAAILDKADALRRKSKRALDLIDSLTQSIFLEMFGESMEGDGRPLAELIDQADRINYGVVQPGDDDPEGVYLVRVSDVANGYVDHTNLRKVSHEINRKHSRSVLRGNEILVSCVGSIGEVAIVTDKERGYNIARAVARVPIEDDLMRKFVAQYLRSPRVRQYFKKELRTVSQPTLNIKQISETLVVLPSRAELHQYESRVALVRSSLDRIQAHFFHCDALFYSLQHRAFSGQL
jgi:type I restriction enzyme S subunit